MLVETNFKIRLQNQPKHPKYVQLTMVLIFIKFLGPSIGKIVKNVTCGIRTMARHGEKKCFPMKKAWLVDRFALKIDLVETRSPIQDLLSWISCDSKMIPNLAPLIGGSCTSQAFPIQPFDS